MKYCKLCGSLITRPSINNNSVNHKIIYCSDKCNKRAYYIRNIPSEGKSFFKNKKEWCETETGKGYKWEIFVANMLNAEWQGFNKPFDVLWNGKSVDVKVANIYRRKIQHNKPCDISKQSGWFVFDKHSEKDIDYLFCIGIVGEVPYRMWLIPYNEVGKGFTITVNSSKKFDKYIFTLK